MDVECNIAGDFSEMEYPDIKTSINSELFYCRRDQAFIQQIIVRNAYLEPTAFTIW